MSGSPPDRRVRRTREAIQSAFSHLVLTRAYDRIRMTDILDAADVARSTFYQHFAGKDDVLCSVIAPILEPLARAGTTPEDSPHLGAVAAHVWENRQLGRKIFLGPSRGPVRRSLAERIERSLGEGATASGLPAAYLAGVIANWQLASLEEWLGGRHRCAPDVWARALARGTRALVETLGCTAGGAG